jgi:hypothetical protein
MLSSNMLLLNLILQIDVTFSTPTPDFINYSLPAITDEDDITRTSPQIREL